MAALFAKLSSISGVVTASRVLQHLSQVPAQNQPALFLCPQKQSAKRVRGLPAVWTIDVAVYLYVTRSDDSVVPDTQMNALLDAIELALMPSGGEVQSLGGLCDHAWIEGDIQTDEGALGAQAVALVPIRILVSF